MPRPSRLEDGTAAPETERLPGFPPFCCLAGRIDARIRAMQELGKMLVAIGVLLAIVGVILWRTGDLGFLKHIGHLPGDLSWEKGGSSFYVPLTTCLLLSVILSFISWALRK